MLTVYGIKTCDTVRKALKWLEAEGIPHTFHDFRKDGLEESMVATWVAALDWESVLNKRSTTWKQLSDEDKNNLDERCAISLMVAHPTLIKRPVFVYNNMILQGFTDSVRGRIKE